MNIYNLIFLLLSINYIHSNDLITLDNNNLVLIRDEITQNTVNQFISDIYQLDSDDIYIYLLTPGGSVIAGNDIIQTIHAFDKLGKNIICIADVAYSMGFVILQACPNRYILPTSSIMQHQLSLMVDGPIEQLKNKLKFITQIKDDLENMEATRLGLSIDEYYDKIEHDWWLYGIDIINNKAADKIVNIICTRQLLESKYIINNGDGFHIYSKCPLLKEELNYLD
jgi:ATP-dependent Clp protease protease subunit